MNGLEGIDIFDGELTSHRKLKGHGRVVECIHKRTYRPGKSDVKRGPGRLGGSALFLTKNL